ncbi:uncharacterized protein I303_101112 [Kwoniella dejecticola CBS 10117]|uniref:WSC domain-containing protein n=1 Tax=Kwoniella dejecticola CBS 10117 TaxID=1296121 RepID=A0A1A6AGV0_9TREE|nr:uncharacterized protein I303_01116 [Kwoniella dejecticola CBS 10117]OBR89291.1 hypothetical protein I303_01116 [Kwoniella dejecticola CBS 10117]
MASQLRFPMVLITIIVFLTLNIFPTQAFALVPVPAGCVSGKYFHDHIINGDGSLTLQPDRNNCKEQCHVTGFKYAYFRKESGRCFCTSSDRKTPPANQQVVGIDNEGRCKDGQASIDYMASPYHFDKCYNTVPGPTSRKKSVTSIEKCLDYCHGPGSDIDSWVVSFIPDGNKYTCKCFASNAVGEGYKHCGPKDAFRFIK